MRFRSYGQTEDAANLSGDPTFGGMDSFTDSRVLRPGFVKEAQNLRVEQGRFVTRPALRPLVSGPIANDALAGLVGGAGIATTFFTPDKLISYTGIIGSPFDYPLGTTLSAADRPYAIQAYNRMICFRKTGRPIEWDGSGAPSLKPSQPDNPGSGVEACPDSPFGLWIANRLVVRDGAQKDAVIVSDDNQSNDFHRESSEFIMGAGSGDEVRALLPFMENQVIVFMRHSVHLISTIHSPTNSTVTEITRQHGCLGPRCVAQSGPNSYFLSDAGLYALTPQSDPSKGLSVAITKTVGETIPMSRAIKPLFARINMDDTVVDQYKLVVHDNKLHCLVALDGATAPRHVLIFDLILNAWVSLDSYGFDINDIFSGIDPGTNLSTLFITSGVNLYKLTGTDGIDQLVDGTNQPVNCELTTRSYTFGPSLISRFNRAAAEIEGETGTTLTISATMENPDLDFNVRPLGSLADERQARFRIRRRGQACSLKFSTAGQFKLRAITVEGVPDKVRRTADVN